MRYAVLFLSTLALLILPAAAHAATVRIDGDALRVEAADGEDNEIAVDLRTGELVVTDSGEPAALAAGAGCDLDNAADEVTCPAAAVDEVDVDAGDRDDEVISTVALRSRMAGGPGDDFLTGAGGNDDLSGDSGNDSLTGGDGRDGLIGGAGDDALVGGAGNDALAGTAGLDSLSGGDGDDGLDGGSENDALAGGAGGDALTGGAGVDSMSGGDGDDDLQGGDSNDTLAGDPGVDVVRGEAGNDAVSGGPGEDRLGGDAGDDSVSGGDDNDKLDGGDGHDQVSGDAGDDVLAGETGSGAFPGAPTTLPGNDTLFGGDGNDTTFGGDGNDTAYGGNGDDSTAGGAGNDTLRGDLGNDRLAGESGTDSLAGGDGDDWASGLTGNDRLAGDRGNDTLGGGDGNDRAAGGSGNDRVFGDRGRDRVDGGTGNDRLEVRDRLSDSVLCGPGRDSARAEVLDSLDIACERVDYGRPGRIGRLRPITGGGRFVQVPGQTWAKVDRRILPNVLYLIRRYKVRIGDGYALTGHKRFGEHPLGLAVDLYPGPGGSWGQVAKLAKWAEPRQNRPRWPFRWIGWNGDQSHGDPQHCRPANGCPPHLHLSWAHSPGRPGHPVRTVWTWQVRR